MQEYLSINGGSDVAAYESGDDYITVLFKDGWCQRYTNRVTGSADVVRMKVLAIAGEGLNFYIIRMGIKMPYAKRWRYYRPLNGF